MGQDPSEDPLSILIPAVVAYFFDPYAVTTWCRANGVTIERNIPPTVAPHRDIETEPVDIPATSW